MRPNIVLIVTDQQRWDALGAYGNQIIKTPHLDQLASEGMIMDRSYVNSPVCTPSRCCILTGRYPRSHGVTCVGSPLPEDERTIGHLLEEAGYQTGAIGKFHTSPTLSSDSERYIESKKGSEDKAFFREWAGPYMGFDWVNLSIGHTTTGNRAHYGLWLDEHYPELQEHFQSGKGHGPFGLQKWELPAQAHSSAWAAQTACQFIKRQTSAEERKPFMLWVGLQDPHPPFACPAPYCDMYDPSDMPPPIDPPEQWEDCPPHFLEVREKKGFSQVSKKAAKEVAAHYYGMVTQLDEQVGRILQTIKELGIEDQTIVVFTTDHGEALGDHGMWLKGAYHYESVIRAPMIWKYPKEIAPGQRTSKLFSHVDILPTLLEFADVEPHPGIQGISQTGVLTGSGDQGRERALCEYRIKDVGSNRSSVNMKTLITDTHKLTYYGTPEYGELFDLASDPGERINLWNDKQQEILKFNLLHELWSELMETEDPLPLRICMY